MEDLDLHVSRGAAKFFVQHTESRFSSRNSSQSNSERSMLNPKPYIQPTPYASNPAVLNPFAISDPR